MAFKKLICCLSKSRELDASSSKWWERNDRHRFALKDLSENDQIIFDAVRRNGIEDVRKLLENGFSMNKPHLWQYLLKLALIMDAPDLDGQIVQLLVDNDVILHDASDSRWSLVRNCRYSALRHHNMNVYRILLQAGLDTDCVDKEKEKPLSMEVKYPSKAQAVFDVLDVLHSIGFDINNRSKSNNLHSMNALIWSIWSHYPYFTRCIIQFGVDMEKTTILPYWKGEKLSTSYCFTALDYAMFQQDADSLYMLLEAGCDVQHFRDPTQVHVNGNEPQFWPVEDRLTFLDETTLQSLLADHVNGPRDLQKLCRLCVRRVMGSEVRQRVAKLQCVPQAIKDYLLLTEFNNLQLKEYPVDNLSWYLECAVNWSSLRRRKK